MESVLTKPTKSEFSVKSLVMFKFSFKKISHGVLLINIFTSWLWDPVGENTHTHRALTLINPTFRAGLMLTKHVKKKKSRSALCPHSPAVNVNVWIWQMILDWALAREGCTRFHETSPKLTHSLHLHFESNCRCALEPTAGAAEAVRTVWRTIIRLASWSPHICNHSSERPWVDSEWTLLLPPMERKKATGNAWLDLPSHQQAWAACFASSLVSPAWLPRPDPNTANRTRLQQHQRK